MKQIRRGFSITSVHSVHQIVIKVNNAKSDGRNRINKLQLLQKFQFQRLMKLIRSMKCLFHNDAALISYYSNGLIFRINKTFPGIMEKSL